METYFPFQTPQEAYENMTPEEEIDFIEHEVSVIANEVDEVYGDVPHLIHLQEAVRAKLIFVDFWPPDDIVA